MWTPTFYWTGDLEKDAELINKPHIAAEGPAEDRTEETLAIIREISDFKYFELKDIFNIQNRLLAKNNWKGIVPGLRTHTVSFEDACQWETLPEEMYFIFPYAPAVVTKETLLNFYKEVQTLHPLSDLNGRVFGIVVAVLYHNSLKQSS